MTEEQNRNQSTEETVNIRVIGENGESFIEALLGQKTLVQATIVDEDEKRTFGKLKVKNPSVDHTTDLGALPFTLITLIPTALPQLTSFINTYMTTHSNEKITF